MLIPTSRWLLLCAARRIVAALINPKTAMTSTFRSIDDLARLDDRALASCLRRLRTAIAEARHRHAVALQQGLLSAGCTFTFSSFTWRPDQAGPTGRTEPLHASTPIDELGLRPRAVETLKDLHVFLVEDLSAISEEELRAREAIGARTLMVLRDALAHTGLAFLRVEVRTRGASAGAQS
ncbi:hypothetical protein QTH90_03720 [Variovorax sp. J2P1-59]|uniref:hypothetical protein n=1 Tax=Variovorax flavidus TaxID=3053501 RepID=UPI00257776A2|nr:hypothetical protein [Variovorax sp. J2P1-59]MDM0073474.1 hypothetical protein [Variovorax sp. J2P1-59]